MNHSIFKVIGFELTGKYSFIVKFDDGTAQDVDLRDALFGELYGPLRDPDFFRLVYLDQEVHTLVWPNGADFDPATLHDWPKIKSFFVERAASWMKSENVDADLSGRTNGRS